MKKILKLTCVLSLLLTASVYAQDSGVRDTKVNESVPKKEKSIKPLRFGVKVGVPSIITANAEYVTPLWNNRVAIAVDYFKLGQEFDGTQVDYSNFEIGSNIYFNPRGKGFYGGVSYTSFSSEGTFLDVDFDNGNVTGDGLADLDYNTFNLKLGVKLGRVFYFRMEAGYGFGSIPTEVTVTSISNPSLTTIEEIPEIPGISDSGILYFNIGIGFGFL